MRILYLAAIVSLAPAAAGALELGELTPELRASLATLRSRPRPAAQSRGQFQLGPLTERLQALGFQRMLPTRYYEQWEIAESRSLGRVVLAVDAGQSERDGFLKLKFYSSEEVLIAEAWISPKSEATGHEEGEIAEGAVSAFGSAELFAMLSPFAKAEGFDWEAFLLRYPHLKRWTQDAQSSYIMAVADRHAALALLQRLGFAADALGFLFTFESGSSRIEVRLAKNGLRPVEMSVALAGDPIKIERDYKEATAFYAQARGLAAAVELLQTGVPASRDVYQALFPVERR